MPWQLNDSNVKDNAGLNCVSNISTWQVTALTQSVRAELVNVICWVPFS